MRRETRGRYRRGNNVRTEEGNTCHTILGPEALKQCRRGGRSGDLPEDKRASKDHCLNECQRPLRWAWKDGVGPSFVR